MSGILFFIFASCEPLTKLNDINIVTMYTSFVPHYKTHRKLQRNDKTVSKRLMLLNINMYYTAPLKYVKLQKNTS